MPTTKPPSQTVLNAEALTALRTKDGQSMTALAAAAGLTLSHLNDLEKGRRLGTNPAIRRALADALNVPVSAIEARR